MICDRNRTCTGNKCFKSIIERDGVFSKYKDEPVEVVNAKLRVIGLLDSPKLKEIETNEECEARERRKVFFESDSKWHDVAVYDRSALGFEVAGPAIIEQYDSTTVVYPDWSFKPDRFGNLVLRRLTQ